MERFAVVNRDNFANMLSMHCWLGHRDRAAMRKAIVDDLFANTPAGQIFPMPFQETLGRHCGLTPAEANYVYDSVYRMLYEMLLGRAIPRKESVCFDEAGEAIPLKKLKRPADFFD